MQFPHILRHEGRDWFTSHRGILWIASTSRQPTLEDVNAAERAYGLPLTSAPSTTSGPVLRQGPVSSDGSSRRDDQYLPAFEQYPPSRLLGYVHVSDCVPADNYRQMVSYCSSSMNDRFLSTSYSGIWLSLYRVDPLSFLRRPLVRVHCVRRVPKAFSVRVRTRGSARTRSSCPSSCRFRGNRASVSTILQVDNLLGKFHCYLCITSFFSALPNVRLF